MSSVTAVVDTSYLLELYHVPGRWAPEQRSQVLNLFLRAGSKGWRLVVARGVAYEMGNHIANVHGRDLRIPLAEKWANVVALACSPNPALRPFELVPGEHDDELPRFVRGWADQLAHATEQRKDKGDVGLSDWSTVEVARLLKQQSLQGSKVHIWTLDARLKRHEPDPEPEPFIGAGKP